jgi:hypothetical protein
MKRLYQKDQPDEKVRRKLNNRELRRFRREGLSTVAEKRPVSGRSKMTELNKWEYRM